jgi:SWIM zinc finger
MIHLHPRTGRAVDLSAKTREQLITILNSIRNQIAGMDSRNARRGWASGQAAFEETRQELIFKRDVLLAELDSRPAFTPAPTATLITETAVNNYEPITGYVADVLDRSGLELTDVGDRYEKAWELVERASWTLPTDAEQPYRVDSQAADAGRGEGYNVYIGAAGHERTQCECRDWQHRAETTLDGYCKHTLAALIIYRASALFYSQHAGVRAA